MATKSKAKKATAKKTNGKGAAKNKTQAVVALMRRAKGVTREEVLALTGWKAVAMQQVAARAGAKLRMEKVEGKPIRYRA